MSIEESKPLRLFLIRHGETEWSISGQHTGTSDIPLTEHGKDEARELAAILDRVEFAEVFCSPRQRAVETCALAQPGAFAKIDPDLSEWDYGDYEGMSSTEIRKTRPGWNIVLHGCPNGEMPEQVSDRADRLILHLRTFNGNIALFSHGQFGGVLAARWIGLSVIEAQRFPLGTASISILAYNPKHIDVAVISMWNLPSHAMDELTSSPGDREKQSMKRRAIERWENEGGEVPTDQVMSN